jgi:hypothetical protein
LQRKLALEARLNLLNTTSSAGVVPGVDAARARKVATSALLQQLHVPPASITG